MSSSLSDSNEKGRQGDGIFLFQPHVSDQQSVRYKRRASKHWRRAMFETPLILKIEGIEPGEVPLTSNIPKSLRINTRTGTGPLVLHISENAAHELAAAFARHWQTRGYR